MEEMYPAQLRYDMMKDAQGQCGLQKHFTNASLLVCKLARRKILQHCFDQFISAHPGRGLIYYYWFLSF